ncbi:N-terminal acetyltransferase A, auxiliary subunit [Parasponia andersonii]|uniref:N-terminal acetyltransferase A, auxiliary subunit n=1 Tax=Parasponia andersonii TaxID=3476 RepID=A0A2P5AAD8_PARAD|nr:N-terminal acetyltransferase A, auxiliary subunit [Parasponia andersonii]
MFLRQAAASLTRSRIRFPSQISSPLSFCGETTKFFYERDSNIHHRDSRLWIFLFGNAAIFLGINSSPVLAKEASIEGNLKDDAEGAEMAGLRKIEDGSVGKLKEAEQYFRSALEEAKQGFGERDPHVASACNNLAELYRVKKEFEKAEPLYLEAINILKQTFGPEDIRVGSACHNFGQFYLVQRKLEEARNCYEIKGRVLGLSHADFADTMYHLGMVLYLQGKDKDAEALILDSVGILEEGGQAESIICVKRLRYLAQIYLKTNRVEEAEIIQRKILHTMELTKGWSSLDTVIAAEGLALTLQSAGSLKETQELLERCLVARKTLLPDDHIQSRIQARNK